MPQQLTKEQEQLYPDDGFPFQEELLIAVWLGIVTVQNLPQELFDYTFVNLADEIFGNLPETSPVFSKMIQNTADFSAAKTWQEVNQLAKLKSQYSQAREAIFIDNGISIDDTFNKNWLAVEKDAARKMAISAREWEDVQGIKGIAPALRYHTQLDSRVRDAHASQEAKVYPVDHPFWDTWYPPNDWNCRCFVTSVNEKTSRGKWSANNHPVFGINPGKTGKVFKGDHPYFDIPAAYRKAKAKNFGLDGDTNSR